MIIIMMMMLMLVNLPSSCRIVTRLSEVTRFLPADKISFCPLRQITVSLAYGFITTHVSKASPPSATVDGPPVPKKK